MIQKLSVIDHLNIPDKTVCCFINLQDKKVYLFYSSNTFNAFVRNLKLIKEQKHRIKELNRDRLKLDFWIMEMFGAYKTSDAGRYELANWAESFKRDGFQLYQTIKTLDYKTKLEAVNIGTPTNEKLVIRLYLVTGRNKKLTVGDFQCMVDAEEHIRTMSMSQLIRQATIK